MSDVISFAHALHREAMDLADHAMIERARGNTQRAMTLSKDAFEKEREAAQLIEHMIDFEPTRSVLFRSAASLALDFNAYDEAEKLVARALAGRPPEDIAEELRDLFRQITFQRHLDSTDRVLEQGDLEVSMDGRAVGYGIAKVEAFIGRVRDIVRLIYRTAERKADRPFREHGRRIKDIEKGMPVYITAPQAGSFVVTLRIGYSRQLSVPGIDMAGEVIDDLLDCVEAAQRGNAGEIQRIIPDAAYRRNFVALLRRIAPDGRDVDSLALAAQDRSGRRRSVMVTAHPEGLEGLASPDESSAGRIVRVQGRLKYADARDSAREQIRVIDGRGKEHRFIVREGLLDDIVRPLWGSEVEAVGRVEGKVVVLEQIDPVDGGE